MLDTQRRAISIGLFGAPFLGWVEAETLLWQKHALEPLVPHENSCFIVARYFCVILVGDVAGVHGQDLGRCLLYSAIGILSRAFDEELEGSLQAGHRLEFLYVRLLQRHFITGSQQAQAAHDMAQLSRLCDIALAGVRLTCKGISHGSRDRAWPHRKTYDRTGGHRKVRGDCTAIGEEQRQDFAIMAYLDESLARGGSDVESSHHGIAREHERRYGQLTVDLLYCFKRCFHALPVQGFGGERKCFDAVARHTITQRDLHLCFSLHAHNVVVNDLWKLQAYPGQCCRFDLAVALACVKALLWNTGPGGAIDAGKAVITAEDPIARP